MRRMMWRTTPNEGGEPSYPPSEREIAGGETSNPTTQNETGGGKEIQVTIDPDLLDCSICFEPLCSPVNQCEHGHVACQSCWSKLQQKCHICRTPVVSRSIALEKILESVHLPCTYAHLGCRKSVSYSQRQVHTYTCEFGLSLCQFHNVLTRLLQENGGNIFWKTTWTPAVTTAMVNPSVYY